MMKETAKAKAAPPEGMPDFSQVCVDIARQVGIVWMVHVRHRDATLTEAARHPPRRGECLQLMASPRQANSRTGVCVCVHSTAAPTKSDGDERPGEMSIPRSKEMSQHAPTSCDVAA